jgi:hypothetical protein
MNTRHQRRRSHCFGDFFFTHTSSVVISRFSPACPDLSHLIAYVSFIEKIMFRIFPRWRPDSPNFVKVCLLILTESSPPASRRKSSLEHTDPFRDVPANDPIQQITSLTDSLISEFRAKSAELDLLFPSDDVPDPDPDPAPEQALASLDSVRNHFTECHS